MCFKCSRGFAQIVFDFLRKNIFFDSKDFVYFLFLSASRKSESAGRAFECADAVGDGVRGRG